MPSLYLRHMVGYRRQGQGQGQSQYAMHQGQIAAAVACTMCHPNQSLYLMRMRY
jgi:hypothetical protein